MSIPIFAIGDQWSIRALVTDPSFTASTNPTWTASIMSKDQKTVLSTSLLAVALDSDQTWPDSTGTAVAIAGNQRVVVVTVPTGQQSNINTSAGMAIVCLSIRRTDVSNPYHCLPRPQIQVVPAG